MLLRRKEGNLFNSRAEDTEDSLRFLRKVDLVNLTKNDGKNGRTTWVLCSP